MVLVKIVLASLVLILGFAGFTTFGIPLIVPEAPPVEEKLSGDITIEQYIALGDRIFNGKGTCTLCHNPVGGRAPILDAAAAIAGDRMADSAYKGTATDSESYLHESLVEPSAYVVAGFGKPGSNDTVSPMPDVSKGAIGLSDVELGAVVAFLQSMAGVDVTVALPSGDSGASVAEEEVPAEIALAANAEEAFSKFECATCHMSVMVPEGGDLGPDLTEIASRAGSRKKGYSAEQYLLESIRKPNEFIVEDFDEGMMPEDYSERMTIHELYLIIDALLGREAEG
jgi:cytochrome c2